MRYTEIIADPKTPKCVIDAVKATELDYKSAAYQGLFDTSSVESVMNYIIGDGPFLTLKEANEVINAYTPLCVIFNYLDNGNSFDTGTVANNIIKMASDYVLYINKTMVRNAMNYVDIPKNITSAQAKNLYKLIFTDENISDLDGEF